MIKPKNLESLARRITELVPADARHLKDDFEQSVHRLLQNSLSRMQLVTREEFEVQSQLLQRTREKLDRLEKELDELHNRQDD